MDRCESCHLGTREPVQLTAANMGGEEVFASHPNKELLKIHDPEKFGCTPCHGGNGVALSSVTKHTGITNIGYGRCTTRRTSKRDASSAT